MRTIEGYVFIADFERGFSSIQGKTVNIEKNACSENFETNQLTPYNELLEAKYFMNKFQKRTKPVKVYIAEVHMRVAESVSELEEFRDKSGLIVIMKDYDDSFKKDELLGPIVEGKNSLAPIPGARLTDTNFTTYTTKNSKGKSGTPFERALYLLSEVNRQSQCGGTIATFNLRKI